MIEKLRSIDANLRNYLCQTKPDIVELWDKVNEIIDMLNNLIPAEEGKFNRLTNKERDE